MTTVVSARKVEKEADPFHALQRQPGQVGGSAPSGVSMYDRHKVYAGVNEFSFEEIHAADWMKRQRRREEKRLEGGWVVRQLDRGVSERMTSE